ncbi:MAG: cell division protein FtsA [Candidatus Colwellbacteria bacterium]|nr:cell division protein FtsA [Candidatus Colwellbacteria bacterium]
MATNTVLGLDIGSENVKAVVAEAGKEKIRLIYGAEKPSSGIRKGSVVSMDDAARTISDVISEVKSFYRPAIRNVWMNVGGSSIRSQISRGIIAVARANSEIYQDDIDRVVKASQAINLPQNRMILHTLTREFVVDGIGDIKDPLGMIGARLEVSSLIVDAFAPSVKNLRKCVEVGGGEVGGLVFNPLASARSVLSKNQRELGVVIIDIGAQTTGIAVYEEDKLLHTNMFPVGSSHITNDLAVALKIQVDIAEKIKITHGYAVSKDVPSKDVIDLKKVDINASGNPSRRFVAEVIESRIQEIFEFVNNDLRVIGKAGRLPAGAVLVGGGAKLPGIADLARQELKLSTQIGLPNLSPFEVHDQSLVEYAESPEYAAVLGLILHSFDASGGSVKSGHSSRNWFVQVLRNMLP